MHSTPHPLSELFEEMRRIGISPKQDFSPPLLLSAYCDAHQMLERMLGGNFLHALPEQMEELSEYRQYQDIWSSIFEAQIPNRVEDLLIRYALGIPPHSILVNRKIGMLAEGSLAILAPATRPGDEVYAFSPSSHFAWSAKMHLLVLRPQLIESGIDAGNPDYETKQDDEGWENTRHFTLIGCAWTKTDDDIQFCEFWARFTNREYVRSNKFWDRRTTAWIH
jgi:hypothetical protein